jgi:hypothetical protein
MQLWMPEELLTAAEDRDRRASIADSTVSLVTSGVIPDYHSYTSSSSYRSASGNLSPSIRESIAGSERARFHALPKKPLLVLFLSSQSNSLIEEKRALIAVELDTETFINHKRCDCHRKPGCLVGCVEQKHNDLHAQRFDAGNDLDKLNLALLGITQRKEWPHSQWKSLRRLTFEFQTREGT